VLRCGYGGAFDGYVLRAWMGIRHGAVRWVSGRMLAWCGEGRGRGHPGVGGGEISST
jgi:hypothetical protein